MASEWRVSVGTRGLNFKTPMDRHGLQAMWQPVCSGLAMSTASSKSLDKIRRQIHVLTGNPQEFDPLLDRIGNARFVLIGEASHGTHEFYQQRAEITKRLIDEKRFNAVAVEADWPDAYRVNRFVRGYPGDMEAFEALGEFKRFPAWMWRNADVLDFIGWLRRHNDQLPKGKRKTDFYGLDFYSLYTCIEVVLSYLDKVDPEAAKRARSRYASFEDFAGYAAGLGLAQSSEDAVVEQLLELQRRAVAFADRADCIELDDLFYVQQNARLVKNAEEYYRSMFRGRVSSWNLRDRHMSDTLDVLATHLSQNKNDSKIIVWAHNSHVGDARETEMGHMGELNLGQLAREHHGSTAVLIGFTTYSGTVTAASGWNSSAERKKVRPALRESYEALFHEFDVPACLAILDDDGKILIDLPEPLLQRAIGVVYRPETERASHYFSASLSHQFDAIIHIDHTRAVEPLERTPEWETGEWETFPTGM
jgi:erythromycin esterase-like protein